MTAKLIWITGISGAGKSTCTAELQRRGYEGFDADEDKISWFFHRETGDAMRPDENHSMDTHAWLIDRSRVELIQRDAKQSVVFLAGTVENERDVWDLFSHVICLVVDDDTVRHRLATRTNNEFGKRPDELEAVLRWNQTVEDNYRGFGATIIDSGRPLSEVVDDIVEAVRPLIV